MPFLQLLAYALVAAIAGAAAVALRRRRLVADGRPGGAAAG